jgi:hypothetical protein
MMTCMQCGKEVNETTHRTNPATGRCYNKTHFR